MRHEAYGMADGGTLGTVGRVGPRGRRRHTRWAACALWPLAMVVMVRHGLTGPQAGGEGRPRIVEPKYRVDAVECTADSALLRTLLQPRANIE